VCVGGAAQDHLGLQCYARCCSPLRRPARHGPARAPQAGRGRKLSIAPAGYQQAVRVHGCRSRAMGAAGPANLHPGLLRVWRPRLAGPGPGPARAGPGRSSLRLRVEDESLKVKVVASGDVQVPLRLQELEHLVFAGTSLVFAVMRHSSFPG
jgi:hypothetical protein